MNISRRVFGGGLVASSAAMSLPAIAMDNSFRSFTYRGYPCSYSIELARDLYALHGFDIVEQFKDAIDTFQDKGIDSIWQRGGFPDRGLTRTFSPSWSAIFWSKNDHVPIARELPYEQWRVLPVKGHKRVSEMREGCMYRLWDNAREDSDERGLVIDRLPILSYTISRYVAKPSYVVESIPWEVPIKIEPKFLPYTINSLIVTA